VEIAARRQALRLAARALEQRLNADASDYAGPELFCSCGGLAPSIMAVTGRRLKAYWAHCTWSGPIITVQTARVDSARATAI